MHLKRCYRRRVVMYLKRWQIACCKAFLECLRKRLGPSIRLSTKSRGHRVADDQLVVRFKALMELGLALPLPNAPFTYSKQIAHTLIQSRGKDVVDVEKDSLAVLQPEFLAQEVHHGAKLGGCTDLEDALLENRRRSHGLEPDGHCRRDGISVSLDHSKGKPGLKDLRPTRKSHFP